MPLGHLGINVADLVSAKAYYDELMPLLAFEPFIAADDQVSYRPADGKRGAWLFFYRSIEGCEDSRYSAGLQHLAFMLKSRAEVRRVHDWATARGAEVMHEPREFPEYHPATTPRSGLTRAASCLKRSATATSALERQHEPALRASGSPSATGTRAGRSSVPPDEYQSRSMGL